jgi:hypothetical protein
MLSNSIFEIECLVFCDVEISQNHRRIWITIGPSIDATSTQNSVDFDDLRLTYSTRIVPSGFVRITGGTSRPSKENGVLPLVG